MKSEYRTIEIVLTLTARERGILRSLTGYNRTVGQAVAAEGTDYTASEYADVLGDLYDALSLPGEE